MNDLHHIKFYLSSVTLAFEVLGTSLDEFSGLGTNTSSGILVSPVFIPIKALSESKGIGGVS